MQRLIQSGDCHPQGTGPMNDFTDVRKQPAERSDTRTSCLEEKIKSCKR